MGGHGDSFDIDMELNNGLWSIALASQAGLDAFCNAIATTSNVSVQPPVLIHVTSGVTDKINTLLAVVENYIRARGVREVIPVPDKVSPRFKVPFSAHKTTHTVTLEVGSIQEMAKRYHSNYTVSAHEFGHLLGLPDEYLDYSGLNNATIRNSQPLWDTLCGQAHAALRNWHAQFNDSMMSIGTKLYPSHAVTIWEAVERMTQNGPNQATNGTWTIDHPN